MRRWSISLFLTIAFATVASAAQRFDVRLTEPASRADLLAGSTLPIAWEATSAPAEVEEWEAFLSIDGGRTYPMRITPHLDASIHRFSWTVPSLPGAEVSILLRFGNEREESEFSFPERATIRGTATVGAEVSARQALDDHGLMLVAWVEGARDGSGVVNVATSRSQLAGDSRFSEGESQRPLPLISSSASELDPDTALGSGRPNETAPPHPHRTAPILSDPILILACRCNV